MLNTRTCFRFRNCSILNAFADIQPPVRLRFLLDVPLDFHGCLRSVLTKLFVSIKRGSAVDCNHLISSTMGNDALDAF